LLLTAKPRNNGHHRSCDGNQLLSNISALSIQLDEKASSGLCIEILSRALSELLNTTETMLKIDIEKILAADKTLLSSHTLAWHAAQPSSYASYGLSIDESLVVLI
jgi:hypothetical protein